MTLEKIALYYPYTDKLEPTSLINTVEQKYNRKLTSKQYNDL